MLTTLKNAIATTLVLFSINVFALDEASTISEDTKKVISSIMKEFDLKEISPTTQKLFANQISFALKDGFYSWWLGNDDLDSSKFKDSKVRIYDLIVANKNRINNITFTYFPSANQVFYVRKQYVEGSSSVILKNFKDYKENKETELKHETNNYGFTKRKGYLDFDIFHVTGEEGMIAYIDGGLIDIK